MIICFPVTLDLPSSKKGLISLGHNHCIPSLGSVLELDARRLPQVATSWEDQTGNCSGARTTVPFACKEGADPPSRAQRHHPRPTPPPRQQPERRASEYLLLPAPPIHPGAHRHPTTLPPSPTAVRGGHPASGPP